MASLIDELRATTRVAEEENRKKESAAREVEDREMDQRASEEAKRTIAILPEMMRAAAVGGKRQVKVIFSDSKLGRMAMLRVEDWCRANNFPYMWSNPNDESYGPDNWLTISWPDEPSGK